MRLKNSLNNLLTLSKSKKQKVEYLKGLTLTKQLYFNDLTMLISCLKDKDAEIRALSYQHIERLFHQKFSKNEFYYHFKYYPIELNDMEIFKRLFNKQQFALLLCIATCNQSGQVRENALKGLQNLDEKIAIPFILFRLSDWVEQVRQQATLSLQSYHKSEFVTVFVEHINTIFLLTRTKRVDLQAIQHAIVSFIANNTDKWLPQFKQYNDKHRIMLAKILVNTTLSVDKKITIFLRDKHFMIRGFAINYFDDLTTEQIQILLNDKASRIRLNTLYELKKRTLSKEQIIPFVADPSASVRDFARYEVASFDFDVVTQYQNILLNYQDNSQSNLQSNRNKNQLIGSLLGIGEIKLTALTELVSVFLKHENPKVQLATFQCLCHIDSKLAYQFAIKNLTNVSFALQKSMCKFLVSYGNKQTIDIIHHTFNKADEKLKLKLIILLFNIGGYLVISDLLIACRDDNETVRKSAITFTKKWQQKIVNIFIKAEPALLQQANHEYQITTIALKKYYLSNPISELSFYLK